MADDTTQDAPGISAEELQALIAEGGVSVIDVRLPFDYFGGRVPGSLNMPGNSITQNADRLSPDERLVLVCEDGSVSRGVVAAARSAGFSDVSILTGGYSAWFDADLPSETISEGMPTPQSSKSNP